MAANYVIRFQLIYLSTQLCSDYFNLIFQLNMVSLQLNVFINEDLVFVWKVGGFRVQVDFGLHPFLNNLRVVVMLIVH